MSDTTEAKQAPKNKSWIFLVAAFIALAVVGVLTS